MGRAGPASPAPRGARSRQGRPGARPGRVSCDGSALSFARASDDGLDPVSAAVAEMATAATVRGTKRALRRNRPATKTRSMRDVGPPARARGEIRRSLAADAASAAQPGGTSTSLCRPTSNPRTSTSRTRPSRSTPTSAPSFTLTTKKATRRRMEEEPSGWWAWTSRRGPRGYGRHAPGRAGPGDDAMDNRGCLLAHVYGAMGLSLADAQSPIRPGVVPTDSRRSSRGS